MTREERRVLLRAIADLDSARPTPEVLMVRRKIDRMFEDDPRPGFWLRWKLRLRGADVG